MQLLEWLFSQYEGYPTYHLVLEIIAVIFGILSVYYSRANNVLVFPTGLVSTSIFVYLLFVWGFIGDMIVNLYYFVMSIYGWKIWTSGNQTQKETPISVIEDKDEKTLWAISIGTFIGVLLLYILFDKLFIKEYPWIPYMDIVTTAIFFCGMWLMAKRKLEHWYFWIIANIVSIPLYFLKGFIFTSFQYLIFLVLAIAGLLVWRKLYQAQLR